MKLWSAEMSDAKSGSNGPDDFLNNQRQRKMASDTVCEFYLKLGQCGR